MREEDGTPDVYPGPVQGGNLTVDPGTGRYTVRILDLQGGLKKELNVSADTVVV